MPSKRFIQPRKGMNLIGRRAYVYGYKGESCLLREHLITHDFEHRDYGIRIQFSDNGRIGFRYVDMRQIAAVETRR